MISVTWKLLALWRLNANVYLKFKCMNVVGDGFMLSCLKATDAQHSVIFPKHFLLSLSSTQTTESFKRKNKIWKNWWQNEFRYIEQNVWLRCDDCQNKRQQHKTDAEPFLLHLKICYLLIERSQVNWDCFFCFVHWQHSDGGRVFGCCLAYSECGECPSLLIMLIFERIWHLELMLSTNPDESVDYVVENEGDGRQTTSHIFIYLTFQLNVQNVHEFENPVKLCAIQKSNFWRIH